MPTNRKISELTTALPAVGDFIPFLDVSDTTMGAAGSTRKVLASALLALVSVPVTSVFGRTGAVVAANGDYTAAQVTNAARLDVGNAFTGNQSIAGGLTVGSAAYPANAQIVVNSNGIAQGTGGVRLNNLGQGNEVVLQCQNGGLYITNAAGLPASMLLGTRVNPNDGSTFVAGSGVWTLNTNLTLTGTGILQTPVVKVWQNGGTGTFAEFLSAAGMTSGILFTATTGSVQFAVNPSGGGFVSTLSNQGGTTMRQTLSYGGYNGWLEMHGSGELRLSADAGLPVVATPGSAATIGLTARGVASMTVPVLVVKGGQTPGTGGHIASFRLADNTEVARVGSDGSIYTAASVDCEGSFLKVGGQLRSNQAGSASGVGSVSGVLPVYDGDGVFKGYAALYDSFS